MKRFSSLAFVLIMCLAIVFSSCMVVFAENGWGIKDVMDSETGIPEAAYDGLMLFKDENGPRDITDHGMDWGATGRSKPADVFGYVMSYTADNYNGQTAYATYDLSGKSNRTGMSITVAAAIVFCSYVDVNRSDGFYDGSPKDAAIKPEDISTKYVKDGQCWIKLPDGQWARWNGGGYVLPDPAQEPVNPKRMINIEYTMDGTKWEAIDWKYIDLYDANDRSYEIIKGDIPDNAKKVRVGLTYSHKFTDASGNLVDETAKLPHWLLPWSGLVNVTINGSGAASPETGDAGMVGLISLAFSSGALLFYMRQRKNK